MPQVLIVDDEPRLLRALGITLRAFSYEVHTAATGADALAFAARQRLDLVILDLGLPDLEGTAVIRALRGWTCVPIIVLSGRTDPATKTQALDLGANYVTKPFSMAELNARIRAVLRRGATELEPATQRIHRIGDWLIDLGAHTVAHSPVANPGRTRGRTRGRTQLPARYLWQLRAKLEPVPSRPRHLITEPGMGYRYDP
jgi:two-component system KDP operon response regulator KdpE